MSAPRRERTLWSHCRRAIGFGLVAAVVLFTLLMAFTTAPTERAIDTWFRSEPRGAR